MAKIPWNNFITKYGHNGVMAVGAWPYANKKDTNSVGKIVPTPYQILSSILAGRFVGDWAIRKETVRRQKPKGVKASKAPNPTAILILISDQVDVSTLQSLLQSSSLQQAGTSQPCKATVQFTYDASDYKRFRNALGF